MSNERGAVVRQAISVKAATRRRPEDHLAVRFPTVSTFVYKTILRLPPRSRRRQVLLRRVVTLGIEAVNRRDYQAAFATYDPAVELLIPPALASIAWSPSLRAVRNARSSR